MRAHLDTPDDVAEAVRQTQPRKQQIRGVAVDGERADERLGKVINAYLNHYISVADGKAGAIAAASLVLLGFAVAPDAQAVAIPRWLGALAAVVAAGFAASVLYPRTPHFGNGHIFWGDIRNFDSANTYWQSLNALSSDEIGLELARQNFSVSAVLLRKMSGVRRAIIAFGVSALLLAYAFGAA